MNLDLDVIQLLLFPINIFVFLAVLVLILVFILSTQRLRIASEHVGLIDGEDSLVLQKNKGRGGVTPDVGNNSHIVGELRPRPRLHIEAVVLLPEEVGDFSVGRGRPPGCHEEASDILELAHGDRQ